MDFEYHLLHEEPDVKYRNLVLHEQILILRSSDCFNLVVFCRFHQTVFCLLKINKN